MTRQQIIDAIGAQFCVSNVELTQLLETTAETVGIPLLGHVILSPIPSCEQWWSMKVEGKRKG